MLNNHLEDIERTFNEKGIQGRLSRLTIESSDRMLKEIKGRIKKEV
jgi:hypothetical protein